jgi:ribulose-phosphate 3-epimerase
MLKCATSLWSADLANLAAEIRRVEPYSDRFHIDVADGHYVANLLFFPDQVKAIRPHTKLPLEIHLMVTDPERWIAPFIEAGADGFILCLDSITDGTRRAATILQTIHEAKKYAGISLRIEEPLDLLEPHWPHLDLLTIMGTEVGVKGATMHSSIPAKIRQARQLITQRNLPIQIEADGGIRRQTVPLLHAAGADYIVPGSLMFKEDPAQLRRWLASLRA